jgi:hypothetical protein
MREGPGQPAWSSRPPAHGASGRLLAGLSSANAQGTRPPSVGLVAAVLTGVSQEGGTPARGGVGRPGAARREPETGQAGSAHGKLPLLPLVLLFLFLVLAL